MTKIYISQIRRKGGQDAVDKYKKENTATCKKCEHTWVKLTEKPLVCPNCKNYKWDTD